MIYAGNDIVSSRSQGARYGAYRVCPIRCDRRSTLGWWTRWAVQWMPAALEAGVIEAEGRPAELFPCQLLWEFRCMSVGNPVRPENAWRARCTPARRQAYGFSRSVVAFCVFAWANRAVQAERWWPAGRRGGGGSCRRPRRAAGRSSSVTHFHQEAGGISAPATFEEARTLGW